MCPSRKITQNLKHHLLILAGTLVVASGGTACRRTPLTLPEPPPPSATDSLADRAGVRSTVRDLKAAGDFPGLNAFAKTLRDEVIHLGTDTPLITWFYINNGPNPTNHRNEEADYERVLARIADWRAQTPDDPTPRILEAYVWLQYATNIRRDDRIFGSTGEKFRERLEKGRAIIKELLPQGIRDAYLYNIGQGIAENLDDEDLSQRVFAEGRKHLPGHIQLYNLRALFIQKKEGGEQTGWSKFLARQADDVGGLDGDRLYALAHFRLLMLAEFVSLDGPKNIGNYERLKRGTFADIEAGGGWSEPAARLCAVAALRNDDLQTARDLLLRTGPTSGPNSIYPETLLDAWEKTGILKELDAIRKLEAEGLVAEAEEQLKSLLPSSGGHGWMTSFALRNGRLDSLPDGSSLYPVKKPAGELSAEEARDMALIRLMAGNQVAAKALADTVRQQSPGNAIPDMVDYGIAVMSGDAAASRKLRQDISKQKSADWNRAPFQLAKSYLADEKSWSDISEEFELRTDQGYLALAMMQLRAIEKGHWDGRIVAFSVSSKKA